MQSYNLEMPFVNILCFFHVGKSLFLLRLQVSVEQVFVQADLLVAYPFVDYVEIFIV